MSDAKKNFLSLLSAPADSVEAPPALPTGTWKLKIAVSKLFEPKDEETPGAMMYGFKPIEPVSDVEQSEIDAFGDAIEDATLWRRFRLRDRSDQYKLRKFLETVGAELSGRSLLEAAQSIEGYEVLGYVDQEPDSEDPDMIYNRLTDFAPVGSEAETE